MSSNNIDEALERRIVRIMATPARYDYPQPLAGQSRYGYPTHICPACGQHCLPRCGGYQKHYTAAHVVDSYKRQIAKRIIKAVRPVKGS